MPAEFSSDGINGGSSRIINGNKIPAAIGPISEVTLPFLEGRNAEDWSHGSAPNVVPVVRDEEIGLSPTRPCKPRNFDRAADGPAKVIFKILGPFRCAKLAGIERCIAQELVKTAMEFVGARLGDCRDHRRSRRTVLRLVI